MSQTDGALSRLQDRAEITDLVHRYALYVRRRDPASVGPLFTDDGAFEVRELAPVEPGGYRVASRHVGREAAVGHIAGGAEHATMYPMIHNLLIDIDGDRATSSCVMVIGRPEIDSADIMGEYTDSYRRENGRWHFSERIYTIITYKYGAILDSAGALKKMPGAQ